jgi:hypothetical protein
MALNEIENVATQLRSKGTMKFLPGATKEQIDEYEATHNIKLPNKLKDWLVFSDGGECYLPAGVQFYGVAQMPVIDVHDKNRPNDNFIVIGALSTGDPILCEKDSERISIYNQEAGRIEDDETYSDFLAFINNLDEILGIEEVS